MRLLGGEEHLCSLLANTACRHTLTHSLFLSFFVVHWFCLSAVQLGGQPRHWGVGLGFCPTCVQKIPPNTLLSYGLESLKAYITSYLLTSGCVALPQAITGIASVRDQLSAPAVEFICSCCLDQPLFSGQIL